MFPKTIKVRWIGPACVVVLCVILALGLWPFYVPRNEVSWAENQNGLEFGNHGSAMSVGALAGPRAGSSCSIEAWIRPANRWHSGTILSFYSADNPQQLSVHQALTDLMLQLGTGEQPRVTVAKVYVDEVFRRPGVVLITVTSGVRGTAVYVNGELVRAFSRFQFGAAACSGRIILADAPLQQDGWAGEARALAIYYAELPASRVLRHYQAWSNGKQPEILPEDCNAGLYRFDEHGGRLAHNYAGAGADLTIPESYTVVDKVFLEPFWEEFEPSWNYVRGILKNIVGFIPLGFCFYAYFAFVRRYSRAALVTVLFGFAVSLTIEVLQGYLPTRDSGTTDLITNTLGTYVGVLAYQGVMVRVCGRSLDAALW